MTCCQTKVFGFIATFYKLKSLSLYDRSSNNVYKTFCYNIYTSLYLRSFVFRLVWGFLAKLCHVQCNNLSLDYCAFNVLSFTTNLLEYQNHLCVTFYCLAFSTSCSREQRNLNCMERTTQNTCLLKELALQTHTRQGICMQGDLCYHFKCIYLLIMMEWSDSRVNSATDMCFRDYCVFSKGNVHGTLSCNA